MNEPPTEAGDGPETEVVWVRSPTRMHPSVQSTQSRPRTPAQHPEPMLERPQIRRRTVLPILAYRERMWQRALEAEGFLGEGEPPTEGGGYDRIWAAVQREALATNQDLDVVETHLLAIIQEMKNPEKFAARSAQRLVKIVLEAMREVQQEADGLEDVNEKAWYYLKVSMGLVGIGALAVLVAMLI